MGRNSLGHAVLITAVTSVLLARSEATAGSSFNFVGTQEIAVVSAPTSLAQAPEDCERLFFTERVGLVRIIENGEVLPDPFLDITSLVNAEDPERGLVTIAFHPDYQNNGYFFLTYTNVDSNSVLARFAVSEEDPYTGDISSQLILFTLEEPCPTHNVGWIAFGPDGYLYVGSGDGGGCTGGQFAQDTSSLLGKILRLDVDVDAFPDPELNYGIPPDNPFVGTSGRDEIWAVGLRNPWRCSFDRVTNDLWIADVGKSSREEINFQPAASSGGENYGWNCMEGSLCHEPADGCTCNQPGLTHPVIEYDHNAGCAVIGGFVYRGAAIPELQGRYLYIDFCMDILRAYEPGSGQIDEILSGVGLTFSFGEDLEGELYLLSPAVIRKIVIIDCNANGITDQQDIARETSSDDNLNGIPDECECLCLWDLDCDTVVGIIDFLSLLTAWGTDPGGPPDFDGDGDVGIGDFLELLANWGPCS